MREQVERAAAACPVQAIMIGRATERLDENALSPDEGGAS
jgi:hypothetical protein